MTLPVGFWFYRPDPAVVAWRKADGRLKQANARKAERPACPARNPQYPSKEACMLSMIADLRHHHPAVKVKAVLADAWYGNRPIMDKASSLCGEAQAVKPIALQPEGPSPPLRGGNAGVFRTLSVRSTDQPDSIRVLERPPDSTFRAPHSSTAAR